MKRLLTARFRIYTILAVATIIGNLYMTMPTDALAAQKTFTCNPIDVAVFPKSRVHVRCSPADGSIAWFALGVNDAAEANRVLSIVSTAFVSKKRLTIWYEPTDLSGGAIGCQTNDCRLIQGVRMF